MPPIVKKPCVNNSQFSYSGKELSPLGNGYSADAEQVGTIMEGRDKSMWMIGIKNGVKVWNRVPTDLSKDVSILADLTPHDMKKADKAPTKKKTPAKKKEPKKAVKLVSAVSESEVEVDADIEADEDVVVVDEKIEPKKKAPVKKKAADVKKDDPDIKNDNEEDDTKEVPKKGKKVKDTTAVKEKPKRQPTDFNNFMSYQIKIIGEENPEMSHKEKFAKVASLWKSMDEDARKVILNKAKKTGRDDTSD